MALREIIGPAGRIEALLDEPRSERVTDADGLVHAGQAGGVRRGGCPRARVWAAGMAFGAWVGLSVGGGDRRVWTLIGIALPVATYEWEAVRTSSKAKFFIHGERDELCPLKDMGEFYARAA